MHCWVRGSRRDHGRPFPCHVNASPTFSCLHTEKGRIWGFLPFPCSFRWPCACLTAMPSPPTWYLCSWTMYVASSSRSVSTLKFFVIFNKNYCNRWAGVTWECTVTRWKRHPTWTRWQPRECCYQTTTLPTHYALLVSCKFTPLQLLLKVPHCHCSFSHKL